MHTNLQRLEMGTLFERPIRLTGAMALMAAGILLVNPLGSASAWAAGNGGDHGGARDQVQQNSNAGYTNYSANPDTPVEPCQSCYGGAGTDAQNLSSYEYGQPKPCSSCASGDAGK
jgi:hypothetical protein